MVSVLNSRSIFFWSLYPTLYSITTVYICNLCGILGIVIILDMRGWAQAMNKCYTAVHRGLPKPFLCGCRDTMVEFVGPGMGRFWEEDNSRRLPL